MAITDATAIKFSNDYLRPLAGRIAQAKWRCELAKEQWDAMGGAANQTKLDAMEGPLRKAADHLVWAYRFAGKVTAQWDADNMQSLILNDAAEELWDDPAGPTQQDPKRPPVTGQDLRRLNWRGEELRNWLERDVFDNDGALDPVLNPVTNTHRDNVLRVWRESAVPPTAFQAATFITTVGLWLTEYETTNPSRWTHILAVAVNPGGQGEG